MLPNAMLVKATNDITKEKVNRKMCRSKIYHKTRQPPIKANLSDFSFVDYKIFTML